MAFLHAAAAWCIKSYRYGTLTSVTGRFQYFTYCWFYSLFFHAQWSLEFTPNCVLNKKTVSSEQKLWQRLWERLIDNDRTGLSWLEDCGNSNNHSLHQWCATSTKKKHLRRETMLNLEADGLQEQKSTWDSTLVFPEQESTAGTDSPKLARLENCHLVWWNVILCRRQGKTMMSPAWIPASGLYWVINLGRCWWNGVVFSTHLVSFNELNIAYVPQPVWILLVITCILSWIQVIS